MFGGIGAFGIITEIVLALDAGITLTSVKTTQAVDTNLFDDLMKAVKVGGSV